MQDSINNLRFYRERFENSFKKGDSIRFKFNDLKKNLQRSCQVKISGFNLA